MRDYNSFIYGKLQEFPLNMYALLFLDFRLQPAYITTAPYDIVYDDNTYLKDIGVADYSAPIQSASVDRQSFSISLVDNSGAFKNQITRSEAGRDARILFGFYNSDGTPNTTVGNLITAYEGFIDDCSYSNDFQEAILTVALSSPLADLSLVKSLVTSPAGMDQVNVDDTSFDRILEDNEEMIKWGKV